MTLSNIFFENFGFFRPFFNLLALFLGKRGLPFENIGRDLHFAPVKTQFRPFFYFPIYRDLEISEIPNIDEVRGIYMASPRGLR